MNHHPINAFRVGNFKAFSDLQHIPIRPLTLIYGANSSGKSSILHSLLLAHHAIKNEGELDIYRTEAGGDAVDLGGFGQYVYKRDRTSQVQWAVDLNPQKLILLDSRLYPDAGLEILLEGIKQLTIGVGIGTRVSGQGPVRVRSFYLEADRENILLMSSRPQGKLQLDSLNVEHPLINRLIQAIIESKTFSLKTTPRDFSEIINSIVPQITAKADYLFPHKLSFEDHLLSSVESVNPVPNNIEDAIKTFFPYRLNQLIQAITRNIETELQSLRYLGPFRTYPPRHFAFSRQQDDNWDAGGGYAWDILLKDSQVRKKVNAWLGNSDRMNTPYEMTIRHLIPDLQLSKELFPHLNQSLQELTQRLIFHAARWGSDIQSEIERIIADFDAAGIKEWPQQDSVLPEVEQLVSILVDDPESLTENWIQEISENSDRISDLVLIDKRSNTPVTHRDVGIGVSQVIPILVSCYGLSDSLIAIEQPEIHLHPKLQAELGSVFAESIKSPCNNRFILETHSEHIMLRLQKLIREGELTPEDISVIYVDCDHKGSNCLQLRLDEEGDFIDEWPNGFFEEDFDEIFG